MSERWITFFCALGALVLFVTMFGSGEAGRAKRRETSLPTTEDRRGNGYHGAMAWLTEERIRTVSVRDRWDRFVARSGLPASGNLLIVTLPAATEFDMEETRALESWVRAGNTLLVMAALSDSPDWAFVRGRAGIGELTQLTGLEFERVRAKGLPGSGGHERQPAGNESLSRESTASEAARRIAAAARAFAQPGRSTLVPNRPHAYLGQVREALALSDYPAQVWTAKVPYDGFVFSLAHERESGQGVLWTRPLGSGRILISTFGSLFTNRALGLADNGRLLANIVGATVLRNGAVLFDDRHQGLGAGYDPEKFYSDPRLYATLGIIAGVWLIWVLGATRLRVPVSRTPAPRESELVSVTGTFLARVLRPHAGARRLFEHFFRRLRERAFSGPDSGGEPWALLERNPRITKEDVAQLRIWYADACAARRVPLMRLHNLLLRVDRLLAA